MMVAPVGYVNHSTIDNVTDFSYNVLAIEGHDVTPDSPLPCPSSGVSIYSPCMLFCQVIICVFITTDLSESGANADANCPCRLPQEHHSAPCCPSAGSRV